jgi:citrate lyase beta subunit
MIESYFFIPGNHPKLVEKLNSIMADHFIIDLEDAVSKSDVSNSLTSVLSLASKELIWIRPVVFDGELARLDLFKGLLDNGFRNFVIPKTRKLNQLFRLEEAINRDVLNEINIILLVENPECLLNLPQIITETRLKIVGIGFGSQGYCTETGMKHNFDFLRVPRFQIMNTAKALNIKCIDIACMDKNAGEIYKNELQEAFDMGFDGKFLIHPRQLEVLKDFQFISSDQIEEAYDILNEFE